MCLERRFVEKKLKEYWKSDVFGKTYIYVHPLLIFEQLFVNQLVIDSKNVSNYAHLCDQKRQSSYLLWEVNILMYSISQAGKLK